MSDKPGNLNANLRDKSKISQLCIDARSNVMYIDLIGHLYEECAS